MKPSLEGVDLRLRRADECLALLNRQRTILLKRKRNRVVGHFDRHSGDYIFRVPGRPPPLALGLTVGEFAHSLRAALDGTLWQLVARGTVPGAQTQFPIYEDRAKFDRKSNGTTRGRWQTAGIRDEDFTFIEGCQPYHRAPHVRNWHPLAMLAYLNDVDKHRYIHAAFAAGANVPLSGAQAGRSFFLSFAGRGTFRMGLDDLKIGERLNVVGLLSGFYHLPPEMDLGPPWPNVVGMSFEGSDDDPAEVVRLQFAMDRLLGVPRRPRAKMEMEPGFLLEISFSDRERPISIFDLVDIRAAVQGIVDRFRPVIG